ncbi:MAG: hypothetical protein ABID40_03825, partial [Candidatus Bipolaricaulota bacterium]
MPLFLALLVFFAMPTVGQSVEATAPWLTVYDEAGHPKWEVRMERLVRTQDGWEGEAVQVHLYHKGAPLVLLRAPQIRADRYGREWTLDGGVAGEGEGFSLQCEQARWSGGLVLVGLKAEGRGLALSATEARWRLGEAVELLDAGVTFGGWLLRFATGRYDLAQDVLTAEGVTATGHGVTLVGKTLTAWPRDGRLRVTEAHL